MYTVRVNLKVGSLVFTVRHHVMFRFLQRQISRVALYEALTGFEGSRVPFHVSFIGRSSGEQISQSIARISKTGYAGSARTSEFVSRKFIVTSSYVNRI